MPLSKHFRFCLWWESFFNGGHFCTCPTRKKSTPVTFFLQLRHVFLRPGVISLRRKMTPRSIFDGGRYSSLPAGGTKHAMRSTWTATAVCVTMKKVLGGWGTLYLTTWNGHKYDGQVWWIVCIANIETVMPLIYWKEKETHILNFLTLDLYRKNYFSYISNWYQLIPTIKFLYKIL